MKLQVGVKLIIQSNGKVLLLQRRGYEHLDGTWDIPGGRINPDESLENALRREVQEEIGAQFTSSPRLLRAQDIFVPKKVVHVVRLTYIIDERVEVMQLSDEHSAAQYMSLTEAIKHVDEPLLHEVLLEL